MFLSLGSGTHLADLIFQKCCDPPQVFFPDFNVKSSSRYTLVHIADIIFRSERLSFERFLCANRAAQSRFFRPKCSAPIRF